ncbi:MAG: AarF/ABC1/UbiB kinase family protein, partial [Roseovarius gahaiensis]
MSDHRSTPRALAVPGTRIARLARFGSMASGMAGSMALNGALQWAGGDRPRWRALLLAPPNAARM